MRALVLAAGFYSALATSVLVVHALFILWVILGAFLARSRPLLRWLHIVSLVWGIITELLPWPCPLTLLEDWLERRAGINPYHGGVVLHDLEKLFYPTISPNVLPTWACIYRLFYVTCLHPPPLHLRLSTLLPLSQHSPDQ